MKYFTNIKYIRRLGQGEETTNCSRRVCCADIPTATAAVAIKTNVWDIVCAADSFIIAVRQRLRTGE